MKVGELVNPHKCNLLFCPMGQGGLGVAEYIIRDYVDALNENSDAKILLINPDFSDEVVETNKKQNLELVNFSELADIDDFYIKSRNVYDVLNNNQDCIGAVVSGSLFFEESAEQLQIALSRMANLWNIPIFLVEYRRRSDLTYVRYSDNETPVNAPHFVITDVISEGSTPQDLGFRIMYHNFRNNREKHGFAASYNFDRGTMTVQEEKK